MTRAAMTTHLSEILSQDVIEQCSLSGHTLADLTLSRKVFRQVDLSRADLSGAILDETQFI
jgi:uncharacterized protein YjbI with pentapeptide repeats